MPGKCLAVFLANSKILLCSRLKKYKILLLFLVLLFFFNSTKWKKRIDKAAADCGERPTILLLQ